MNYQGRLTDASGNAVPDGSYSINFNLYAALSGGPSLWSETQSVTVTKGLFNAALGSVNSLNSLPLAAGNADLWIGVAVGADAEMTPRQQLLPVAYAKDAQSLAGLLPSGSANNLMVLDSAGKIPAGLVKGSSLSLPFDLTATSSGALLSLSNSSASSPSLGLSVWGNNALQAQAGDGVGLSATTQSASNPALFAAAAFPAKFVASSAASSNAALQASTSAGDQSVNLADRGNKAGLYANVSGA